MGLIIGSGSFTRFVVDGRVPPDYLNVFPKKISRFAFQSLDEFSDIERSAGWVNIMDLFDRRFHKMDYLKEPCIALTWRVDVRKVPSKALLQYCREAEEEIMQAEGLEYINNKRRRDIRDGIRSKLIRRAIPQTRNYDMIWNLDTGLVFFGSTGVKICDEFAEFFFNCFDLNLKSVFPYAIAAQVLEQEGKAPSVLDGLVYSVHEGGT
jgi:hypothetical protein